jgi:hypothetical protein
VGARAPGVELRGPARGLAPLLVGRELVLGGARPHVAEQERDLGEGQEVLDLRVARRGGRHALAKSIDARRILVVAAAEGPDLGREGRLRPRGGRTAAEQE